MKNLFKALANFQQEVPIIMKDTQAYGYKYADLPAILPIINPLLKKNGIAFTQLINGTSIKAIVFHVETAEQIESITDIPQGVSLKGMNDFQVLGSAITYIRRYALSSILGLVTDKDTDASGEQEKKQESKQEPKEKPALPLSGKDFDKVLAFLQGGGKLETVRTKWEISTQVEKLLTA